jgi:hypothetical protein
MGINQSRDIIEILRRWDGEHINQNMGIYFIEFMLAKLVQLKIRCFREWWCEPKTWGFI